MTTIVLGAGAMGSLVAGRLAVSGADAILLGRPSPHLAAVADHGLRMEAPDGTLNRASLRVATAPESARRASALIVLVKAWATGEALAPLAPHLPPEALVVTLQNGLGNRERLVAALPGHPLGSIAAGITTDGALRSEAGTVAHTGHGETRLGLPHATTDARLDALAGRLTRAGLPTSVVADVDPWLWRKVAINAAINGLTSLAAVENGTIADDPELAGAARQVAAEVAAVAAALGIAVPDAAGAAIAVARATARNRSSMLRDLDRGERTEVDAIHGAVVERARAGGMDAPLCATLAALIRARERSAADERRNGR